MTEDERASQCPTGGVIVWLAIVWGVALILFAAWLGGHIDEIFAKLP